MTKVFEQRLGFLKKPPKAKEDGWTWWKPKIDKEEEKDSEEPVVKGIEWDEIIGEDLEWGEPRNET